jgi:group I intron endonuclease
MQEKICGIYCIENLVNGKKYIGYADDMVIRWRIHLCTLKKNNHDNDHLQKSWNKYGSNKFKFYVIELCEEVQLKQKEKGWIKFFAKGSRKNFLYNLTDGGDGVEGYKHSEEMRKMISERNKGKVSDGTLKNLREMAINRIGIPRSKEEKINIGIGITGKRRKDSKKYVGVNYEKRAKKWRVRFGFEGIRYDLGYYDNELDAAKVYDKKCWEKFHDLTKLNFPEDYQLEVLY